MARIEKAQQRVVGKPGFVRPELSDLSARSVLGAKDADISRDPQRAVSEKSSCFCVKN